MSALVEAQVALLRRIADALPVLVAYVDAEERFRFVNRAYAEWYGRVPGELEGRLLAEVASAEGYGRIRPWIAAALAGEEISYEMPLADPAGRPRFVKGTFYPDRDGAGVVHGLTAYIEDITATRQAEAARAQVEGERDALVRKLQAILDLLPVGVAIADDPSCTVIRGNRELGRIAGSDHLANVSTTGPDPARRPAVRVFAGDRELPTEELPARLAIRLGGPTPTQEYRLVRGDGGVVHITGSAVPLRDADGVIFGSVSCYTDVTALKHESEELARREAFLRLVTDAVPGFLWAASPTGEPLYASRTYETYVGLAPGTYRAHDWSAYVHPDDRDGVVGAFAASLAAGTPLEIEYRLRRHDGEYRTFLVKTSPERDADGTIRYWVGFTLDVTDRREADAQLRRAEQLQVVGTLAGGVAHEVNNQMSVVLGFGQLALRKLGPGHPATRNVEQILAAGRRAAEVTGQLLAFSRRQVLQPTVLDLHEVISAFVPVIARVLGADKEIVLRFAAGPVHVVVDRGQLERALVNLAANARDAMPGQGTLTLETALVRGPAGTFGALTVADDGVGMPPEVLARAFEPFFTTKPVGAGSGLGLPTVYGIVTQSGGRVELESAPSVGTRVRLLLPAAVAPAAGAVAAPGPDRVRSGLVLVVEDEPALRDLMATVLREVGFDVRVATDGEDAFRLVEALGAPPALLCTDLVMPKHNGREVVARLRERWPVPALYLSGYAGDEVVRRGLLDAGTPFLQKPFTSEQLLDAVDRVLGG